MGSNDDMGRVWAGAEDWVRNEVIFDAVFAPFTDALVAAAELDSARRVLDVGCGAGTLLQLAAAAGAEAVGVDISPAMVDAARTRAPDATVVMTDAQSADLLAIAPGFAFDRVVSRFGVMFFGDPVAAFTNLRRSAAGEARLAFVAWSDPAQPMFTLGLRSLMARLDDPPPFPSAGAPGPLGLSEPERTRRILDRAGWVDVRIDALDAWCDFAVDGSDGVEERLAVALSGMTGRAVRALLEPQLGEDAWAAALEGSRQEIRGSMQDGSVRFMGHTWLVTATT